MVGWGLSLGTSAKIRSSQFSATERTENWPYHSTNTYRVLRTSGVVLGTGDSAGDKTELI